MPANGIEAIENTAGESRLRRNALNALPIYVFRVHRSELSIYRHALLPIAGTLIMLFPLWGLVQPGQPWPFNIFPWIALGALGVSAVYGIVIARLSPGLADRIGIYVADR
jgi:hypothetical protein